MIYNALGSGNDEAACSIFSECAVELLRGRDMYMLGLVSNLLHDMLILLKKENPAILSNDEIPQRIRGREEELFNKQFPECFRRIGQQIRQSREESISLFGNQILEFINLNLYNPNLYTKMVQDHFNISQPTLQKLIKEITGHTFLSYVETSRFTRAKELLSEGVFTVREVSEKCGFSSRNSFYKAFKRFYGFPPSDINNRQKEFESN
jgi:AraC-like DNA-binding protein